MTVNSSKMVLYLLRTHPRATAVIATIVILLTFCSVIAYLSQDTTPVKHYYFNPYANMCRVPDMDPRDTTILKYLAKAAPIVCSDRAPLTFTTSTAGRHEIHVDQQVVGKYNVTLEDLQCSYSVVTRISDTANSMSSCIDFKLSAVLNASIEFLYVSCIDEASGEEVYRNMHAMVQKRAERSTNETGHLNILLFGIDSMSRLNMMRTMPKTVAHLKSDDWLEFKAYNKVGDNTIPNLLAILAGTDLDETKRTNCYPKENVKFDECPYIWNDFRNAGYFTVYAEDEFESSTFNFLKGGFEKPPTDFYFRTFITSAEQELPKVMRDDFYVCLGPTLTTDIFVKLTLDLVNAYNKIFSFIWLNNFSHSNSNNPALFDGHFLSFMEALKADGVLDNTLVLFLSDHGSRFGKLRTTYIGWLEERLPFFFMWVPKWFREAHPKAYRNLEARSDLLTSPYDLHLTLKEIVDGKVGKSETGCQGCPTCRSMFSTPLKDRSCVDAGITSHWCACAPQEPVSNSSDIIVNATQHVVDVINKKLSPSASVCARLTLKTIVDARSKKSMRNDAAMYEEYAIVFETTPGTALFDASVRFYSAAAEKRFQEVGIISRINSYGNQSACVNDKDLKLYCYCIGD